MNALIEQIETVEDPLLRAIAYMPTKNLDVLISPSAIKTFNDVHFMRIAVFLAEKSYLEGGCPIGAVVVDNETKQIVGKGHNTLVQDGDPYNHGETSAMRDAGRVDFSKTTLYTTLSPCDICTSLLYMRGVERVVVGDVTNANGNEALLSAKGLQVDVLEDEKGIALYAEFRAQQPQLELEDWQGVQALSKQTSSD
jgi:creatinine deaminase